MRIATEWQKHRIQTLVMINVWRLWLFLGLGAYHFEWFLFARWHYFIFTSYEIDKHKTEYFNPTTLVVCQHIHIKTVIFPLGFFSYVQQMFKMLPLCANTSADVSWVPLVDSRVDIVLMQTMPDFDQSPLQFINTVYPCLVYTSAARHPKSCDPRG